MISEKPARGYGLEEGHQTAEPSLHSVGDARARKSTQSPAAGWWQEDSPWRHFQDAVPVGALICYVSLHSDGHLFPHVQVSNGAASVLSALKDTQASSDFQEVQLISQVLLGLGFKDGIASGFSNSRAGIMCRRSVQISAMKYLLGRFLEGTTPLFCAFLLYVLAVLGGWCFGRGFHQAGKDLASIPCSLVFGAGCPGVRLGALTPHPGVGVFCHLRLVGYQRPMAHGVGKG